MSRGGTFRLISSTGLQDRLIYASDLLRANIRNIMDKKVRKLMERNHRLRNPQDVYETIKPQTWLPSLDKLEKTHIFLVRGSFKPFVAIGYEYYKTGSMGGNPKLGERGIKFTLWQNSDFFSDAVIHIRLKGLRSTSNMDKVRYVGFPGHRIVKELRFKVNNNPMDSINSDDYNAYYNFHVPPGKKDGWKRCMGQEIPYLGHVTPNPAVDEFREYRWIGNGNQTFKREHGIVDLWIPVLMWFKDFKCAFPQLVVPGMQTVFELDLETANNMISYANYGGGGTYIEPSITICDLYLNRMFILDEMRDIFLKNFGFSLIRVHLRHKKILKNDKGSILLNEIKWPTEVMYMGFRPRANITNSQNWYKNMRLTSVDMPTPVVITIPDVDETRNIMKINNVRYYEETPVVDSIEIRAHDITLYKDTPGMFYGGYVPYRYGKAINTPEDMGWYMIPFNTLTGEYQPSGHLNVSKTRELYVKYLGNFISPNNATDFITLADCINFLVIKNGNAVLKFVS